MYKIAEGIFKMERVVVVRWAGSTDLEVEAQLCEHTNRIAKCFKSMVGM